MPGAPAGRSSRTFGSGVRAGNGLVRISWCPALSTLVSGPSSAAAFELRADGSFRYAPAAGLTEAIDLAELKLHRVM